MDLRQLAKESSDLLTELDYKLWDAARAGDRQRHDRLERIWELAFKRYKRRYNAYKSQLQCIDTFGTYRLSVLTGLDTCGQLPVSCRNIVCSIKFAQSTTYGLSGSQPSTIHCVAEDNALLLL